MEDSLERQCLERALPLTLGKYDETPGETTGILAENQGGKHGNMLISPRNISTNGDSQASAPSFPEIL